MIDLLSYIVREVKSGRLKKAAAAALLSQMRLQNAVRPIDTFIPVKLDGVLHPLLQSNTSDLSEQRFSSTFIGNEFFLSDHVVRGSKVLPGVCYLEMARAAVAASALEAGEDERVSIVLKNVVWAQPVVVDECTEIHLGVYPDEQGELAYEIYSATGEKVENEGELERVIHSQGYARIEAKYEAEHLDLSSLQQGCDQRIEIEACYAAFIELGLKYGPAHRGLTSIQRGVDSKGGRYVLAQVQLPECVSETQGAYGLHPSVLDSALQASVGLALQSEGSGTSEGGTKPRLPFALESLEIFERSPARGYVYARLSGEGDKSGAETLDKLDIDVCDETGRVCVRLKGFTSRALESEVASDSSVTLLLQRQWQSREVEVGQGAASVRTSQGSTEGIAADRVVCLHRTYKDSVSTFQACMSGTKIECADEYVEGGADDPGLALGKFAWNVFAQVESILQSKPQREVLLQVVITHDAEQGALLSAVSGLLKSAHQEHPKFQGQVIEVDAGLSAERLARLLNENAGVPQDQEIRYVGDHREVAQLCELPLCEPLLASGSSEATRALPWKDHGVYLITGGAGGLGLIFAAEIAAHVKDTKIILTGRSRLSEEKQSQLARLQSQSKRTHIEYRMLEVTDAAAVTACIKDIVEQHGSLNGIVHSAGVIHDNFIIKKTRAEFDQVLAPKVAGTINLDRATQHLELDFLILFSSVTGVFGNVGQSDYATANAFMDRYAVYRDTLVQKKERHGRTLSINWPLWAEGGMQVDAATWVHMQRQGWAALSSPEGIEALYRAYGSGQSQGVVLTGERRQLQRLIDSRLRPSAEGVKQPATTVAMSEAPPLDRSVLLAKVQRALLQLISRQLKVKIEDIDSEAELGEFGFDSISLTAFGNTLNQTYGLELSPTIFFEYPTVRRFAGYLASDHAGLLAEQFALGGSGSGKRAYTVMAPSEEGIRVRSRRAARRFAPSPHVVSAKPGPEAIAIIGMSGCFPGAATLDAFWENLQAGTDSITEIPTARWDWRTAGQDEGEDQGQGQGQREGESGTGRAESLQWGAFIEGVDEFDPLFFNISPREAQLMDPQQRLLLTYTWKAIEDAGYAAQRLSGSKTGIFIGTASTGYSERIAHAQLPIEGYSSTGAVASVGPNRMSYLLNLHGPSEPIETACSSSLVAIHRAVRAMQSGDCEMALVGGINTILTPWVHLSFSKAGMLSASGRCKTFSKEADGYVRGEGVGILFLKKLSQAEREGDHIYGLIKGSSENHGGRANSLTAPNPQAQAELIKAAYREAKIDPRSVSYIEAHGTGTPLGDPIEINGLKSAFSELYQDRQLGEGALTAAHCGLGSVKTNIGHLELAAGVAGVIKVLLQLKHKTLVKSLHCAEINPYIELQDSPFYLLSESQPWEAIKDQSGRALPRRAGISSFGFGGVNAHVIVEEYCEAPAATTTHTEVTLDHPALIVLSAKTEERLQAQAQQLLAHLSNHSYAERELVSIAYTLQVGREAMEQRLAFTATSLEQFKAKLQGYLAGQADHGALDDCYRGDAKKNKDALSIFNTDDVLQQAITTWMEQGRYSKLLELWVKGLVFDWQQLYPGTPPQRLSLPTYPFAKERYWIERSKAVGKALQSLALHPLLQTNTSDIAGLRFSSTFSGNEFFLVDHVVQGVKVLPGVCYLEMARAAVAASAVETGEDERVSIVLKNVVWAQPVVVGARTEIHLGVYPDEKGELTYEIYSETSEEVENESEVEREKECVIHSQGYARIEARRTAERLDLSAFQQECDQRIEIEACYAAFGELGLKYGPAHRGLTSVQRGVDSKGGRYVLAQVQLPECVSETQGEYGLHPSVVDSALQASVGLTLSSEGSEASDEVARPRLPFALESLEIFERSPARGYVYVRSSSEQAESGAETLEKLDIDVCDEQGRVCVRLKGFTSRVLESDLLIKPLTSSPSSAPPASVVDLPGSPSPASLLTLREQATAALKRLVGQVLQIPVQQLDASEPLEKYGVDSILVVKMTGAINTVFSHVASTVFFEYRTLAALVDHLITTQPEAALRWVGLEARVGVRALQGEGTERSEGAVAKLPQGRRARRYGLRSMRRMAEGVSEPWATPVPQAIAIIGLSGRYPQANTVHEFWEHLKAGKACISEIPADRWDWRAYYSEEKGKLGSMYSKWGGFMEEIGGFDPLFFHLSPREAERMDPQERLFLQEAYASIEDAGYTPKNLSTDKQVGVYVGVMNSTYHRSPSYWSVANRVSYLLDFQGPSLAVDTACSSSLTAIHLAVESLRSGHCQCALAGGVNLIVDPIQYLGLSAMTMLSSGPECKSFGDQADGFVDGEGVGVIVLKRLSQAIADHDHIYGVIKGSALNAGGKTHGYTVPNLSAQAQVIGHALKDAQVDARTISYIEAHGTGTSLGDPIEIAGLNKAFGESTSDRQFCALGSAKSNIGHLESAAGIAGLTKVLLQMKHRTLVPSLHSEVLNPQIDFASTPFRVQQSLTAWPRPRIAINHEDEKEYPRIAGISSFGAGGANAHVIVEEYCVPQSIFDPSIGISADHPALIVLSAKTEERLQIQVQQLLAHLTDHSYAESELVSIAYTLQVGREAMEQRIAFTATSLEQLKAKLQGYLEGQLERGEIEACYRGEVKKNKEALAVFTVDEELQEALGKWLQRGKYTKLLELWVKGLMFDWLQLYPSTQPQRVSLPTYPFAKDRYWVEDSDERMVAHAPGGGSPEGGYSDDAEDSTWEAPPGAMSADEDLSGSVWLAPRWDVVRLEAGMPWPLKDARVVLAGGSVDEQQAIRVQYAQGEVLELSGAESVEALAQRLQSFGSIDHVVWITPRSVMDEGVDEGTESFEESLQAQAAGVLSGFRLIKALLHLGYGSRALGLSVVTWQTQGVSALDAIQAGQASVHGLIGSLAKECVNWQIRLIDLPLATPWPLNELLRLPADREGNAWAYRSGDWYRQQVVPCSVQAPTAPSFRQGGVYVVIGGAGGIGEVFSEYLIQHYDAQVIWIGRRALDASIQAKLDRLSHFGPTPLYVSADAGDRAALEGAYQEIKQRYPRVHGVVHSAIALLDKSLANMDEARFTAGLSAKVAVSVRLAQVFGAEPLDFVLFFSSLQSFTKAAGQSNYAAGCTFIDAFAHQLSQQWSYPVKVMHWGYWGSVGVVASEDYRTRMAHAGMGSIEPEEGMRALETLLGSSFNQLGYVKTTQPQALAGITGIASEAPLIELPRSLPALTLKNAEEHASEASLVELRAVVADTSFNEFEAVLSKLLAVQLHSLKLWDLAAGADAEDGTQRVQLPGVYERWLTESVRILTEHGYLQQIQASDGALRVVASAALDPSSVWSEWETQKPGWLDVSSLRAQVSLVEATLRVLPEILTEKIPATDILFPHSSMERVEGIYKGNPVSDYFNEVVAQRLVGYLNARLEQDPTTRLRILEIGAGTGGTSAAVFAALKPYQDHMAEYCYTDVSKAFLLHAQAQYGEQTPYLKYQLFNVERPLAEQGLAVGEYDVVIAANVLHATRHIRQTVRNTQALLKRGGVLLLNEISQSNVFAHLTFGLLKGWWLYDDAAVRIPGTPGLSPASWHRVLTEEGFESIGFPAEGAHDLGQQIVMAQSNGVIRQPRASTTMLTSPSPRSPASSRVTSKGSRAGGGLKPVARREAMQGSRVESMHESMRGSLLESHVREVLVETFATALKMEVSSLDTAESFADYGLDSIIGVQAIERLNEALGIELTTTSLFDYSTVNKLTGHIVSAYPERLARALKLTSPSHENGPAALRAARGPTAASSESRSLPREPGQPGGLGGPGEQRESETPREQGEPIAIVGLSGRYAKANTVDELWSALAAGADLIEPVTRWDLSTQTAEAAAEGKSFCGHGGFLHGIDEFDSLFFNISGVEATYMDPQQRLFLEEAWKALEAAGYAGAGSEGSRCGVYVGYNGGDYQELIKEAPPAQAMWGNAASILSARIAYYLNLQGPAITIDSACSSSLVAIHLACQSLWNLETDLSIAGGVCVQCTPGFYAMANRAGMLSASGRCHTFDNRADGFVPGEGVGVVVLRRLSEAIEAGDHIEGVIRGSGINQDGATNGITAPSALSQERLERQVYERFQIHAEEIQMVEAHGTGTKLGDPIEYQALTNAFRQDTDKTHYCAIGSIKTNIGHTTAAAGVAGVIKVLLSLKHQQIPASLHYENGNTHIAFENSPFYVNTTLKDWLVDADQKRCAAVSSFGMSGTNAHLVIEEAPTLNRVHAERPGYLVVLSARSEGQLRRQVEQLIEHCERQPTVDCGNVSYTLLLGRRHFNYRLACIASNGDELKVRLKKWLEKDKAAHVYMAALQDKDRREQPSLKRYGNQCIEECSELHDPSAYLEHLSMIADLYIQGYPLNFERLFAGDEYSRLSLPTYPFAKERYWVGGILESKHPLRKTDVSKQLDNTRIEQLLESLITNELDEVTVIEQLRMTAAE